MRLITVNNNQRLIRMAEPQLMLGKTRLVTLTLGFTWVAFTCSGLAARTNLLEDIRAAIRPRPSAWGAVSPGAPASTSPGPDATKVAGALSHLLTARGLAQRQALPPVPNAPLPTQAAIASLRSRAGQDVEVYLRPGNQTVAQIRGRMLTPAVSAFALASETERGLITARKFLLENRDLLRLDDPERELRVVTAERDELGRQQVRLAQVYGDLEVWPTGISVQLDRRGNVTSMDGSYVPTPSQVLTLPFWSVDEAAKQAQGSVPGGRGGQVRDSHLIVFAPLAGSPQLAWKIRLAVDFRRAWEVVVDARNGRVLNRYNLCYDANVAASGKDLAGQNQTFSAWAAGGKYYLADTTKPMYQSVFDPVKDPHGVISIFDARELTEAQLKTVYLIESTSASTWIPDAVSAIINFSNTYEYYRARHNRNSLDGNGGNIQAAVRVAEMDNAFWSGDVKMMFFGNVRPYPLALDVVGHELTHGVTQFTADLIYELQPGALNESFSDIFGEMIEARTSGQPDWVMGAKLGKIFRDFKNPGALTFGTRPYPSKMSEYIDLPNSNDSDHGGVHVNSSIINHAFYLLAEGLTGAIGTSDAEKIFYRCLTQHLQKQSQFIDTRLGCEAAAEELFGANSAQARKVAEAFDAVEIHATPPTPEPTPLPPVAGPDSTLFVALDPSTFEIALGRRETAQGDPVYGVALVESIKPARPAVSGDGRFALFVDSANDLCGVDTDNPNSLECLGYQGVVHSVAVSPDARLVAFVLRDPVTGQAQNQINVVDLSNNQVRSFDLVAPVLDGSSINTVLYADAMVFTSDSKQLIYDALSEIRFGSGNPVQNWSIFRLDLASETTTFLVPPLEGADFGNPNLGRAGNRYLTFDARDEESGLTGIINLDLFTGDAGLVGGVGQGFGVPCFTGDESALIYAAQDPNAFFTGYSLVIQPLSADRLSTNGLPSIWLSDATIGVVYRRGTFVGSNSLPTVSITAPTNNAKYNPGANISLAATATDVDGAVTKVEFYQGDTKLGESVNAPFSYSWNNVAQGSYRLIARAYDNLGAAADSDPVKVTVGTAPPVGSITLGLTRMTNQIVRLRLNGPSGRYTAQQSTNLHDWIDLSPITLDASGHGSIDDASGPAKNRQLFYRVRQD
jgi:bacillolysin